MAYAWNIARIAEWPQDIIYFKVLFTLVGNNFTYIQVTLSTEMKQYIAACDINLQPLEK